MNSDAPTPPSELTIYYDGGCPLCRREIGFYRQLEGAQRCQWQDISAGTDDTLDADLTRADALAVFHVRDAQGRLHRGADAFALLLSQFPTTRWLGRALSWRLLRPLAALGYRLFLYLRPLWRKPERTGGPS